MSNVVIDEAPGAARETRRGRGRRPRQSPRGKNGGV
jgi:hypothetical protein